MISVVNDHFGGAVYLHQIKMAYSFNTIGNVEYITLPAIRLCHFEKTGEFFRKSPHTTLGHIPPNQFQILHPEILVATDQTP